MTTTEPMTALPVIATGRRGARYVEVQATPEEGYVVVITTRGTRYVVRTESVTYA